jgi:hypothetical protein
MAWSRMKDALLGPPVPVPHPLPPGVVVRTGRWIPVFAGMLGSMSGPAAAVTLRGSIVVYPGHEHDAKLLAHELVHVQQWRKDRWFPVKYALGSLRHGYWMNPYEVEARAEADRLFPPDPTRTPRHA